MQGNLAATGNYVQFGTNVNVGIGSTSTGATFVNNGLALLYATANINNAINLYGHNFYSVNYNATSGTQGVISLTGPPTFTPTSGTAVFNALNLAFTINQTGGANGITRGIYVNPTITAAANFRAIETTAGNIIFNGGNVGIGLTPIYKLDVNGVVRFQSTGTSSVTHSFLFRNDNSSYGGFTIGSSGQSLSIQQASGYGYLTAAGFFIGSTNSNIWTNNGSILDIQNAAGTTTYLRVASTTGNVLIGTTTDAGYKLDVNGTARFSNDIRISTSSGATIFLGVDVNNTVRVTDTYAKFQIQKTSIGGAISINGGGQASTTYTLTDTGHAFGLGSNNTTADTITINRPFRGNVVATTKTILNISTSNETALSNATLLRGIYFNPTVTDWTSIRAIETTSGDVVFNGGNVGIGTPTPTELLHIVNNTNGNKFARISAGAADASAAWVAQNDQVDNIVYRVFGSGVAGFQMGIALARSASLIANLDGTGKFLIGTYSNTDIIFGTGDQSRIRVSGSNGNVMIGTLTDIGTKLNVSGEINSAGYRVNNVFGWSGTINIPTTPPISITVDGGIITNVV